MPSQRIFDTPLVTQRQEHGQRGPSYTWPIEFLVIALCLLVFVVVYTVGYIIYSLGAGICYLAVQFWLFAEHLKNADKK